MGIMSLNSQKEPTASGTQGGSFYPGPAFPTGRRAGCIRLNKQATSPKRLRRASVQRLKPLISNNIEAITVTQLSYMNFKCTQIYLQEIACQENKPT